MQEVLDKIKPSKEEQVQFKKVVTQFIKQLNSKLNNAKAILGGSGAKDTWLSGSHDIDIFVQFDYLLLRLTHLNHLNLKVFQLNVFVYSINLHKVFFL